MLPAVIIMSAAQDFGTTLRQVMLPAEPAGRDWHMTGPGLFHQDITDDAIAALYDVYNNLAAGQREYIYSLALEQELLSRGHRVRREVGVMVYYKGKPLARQRVDMIVDDVVLVENKAGLKRDPDAVAQAFGYLCCTTLEVGLVFHYCKRPSFDRVFCENRYKACQQLTDVSSVPPLEAPQI